ncbi:MAG: hypothetical protein LBV18_07465 [Alistipes sp.]|jgi:hypothetical protein|nr:hypothetical protein [Alistipes sp.]
MKKLILLSVAFLAVCASAAAQDETQEQPRKRGGFLNALKKGVESSTGLDVSNEALFVYPEIGVWKISVASCVGNRDLGTATLVLRVAKISGTPSRGSWCLLSEAETSDGVELGFGTNSADPLFNFEIGKPIEVPVQIIGGVPDNATALNVKFYIGYRANAFEGRDIPIAWAE